METEVLEKGEVIIPISLRRRLGIKPGDALDADIMDKILFCRPALNKNKPKKHELLLTRSRVCPLLTLGKMLRS